MGKSRSQKEPSHDGNALGVGQGRQDSPCDQSQLGRQMVAKDVGGERNRDWLTEGPLAREV